MASRSLIQIIKSNFDTFNAVEKIIKRILAEMRVLEELKHDEGKVFKCLIGDEVSHKDRREMIRVLFRLLNNSTFKNDQQLSHLNPNYVPNSRKILESELFTRAMELAIKEETSLSPDLIEDIDLTFSNSAHLLSICFNDIPAQITNGLAPQFLSIYG